ncbi:MAG: hypothetical protein ACIARQ_00190 [Phycisphaerales bacterium JB061]
MGDKGYPVVCRHCKYDRAGLFLSAPCPECGSTSIRILHGRISWHPRWLLTIALAVIPLYFWATMALELQISNYPPDPFDGLNTIIPLFLLIASWGAAALDACASVSYSRHEPPILAVRIYNVIGLLWLCFMLFLSTVSTVFLLRALGN